MISNLNCLKIFNFFNAPITGWLFRGVFSLVPAYAACVHIPITLDLWIDKSSKRLCVVAYQLLP